MATVRDLIEFLQDKIEYENMDPNAEIVGVFQPSHPLSSTEIYIFDPNADAKEDDDDKDIDSDNQPVVYIGLGEGYNYGVSRVYDEGESI